MSCCNCSTCKCTNRLGAFPMAMAFGIMTGLWMMLFAWSALYWGHGADIITQWSSVYQGYEPTIKGGVIGGIWGFVEGFIFGLFFAWIYNCFLCCCKCLCKSGKCKVKEEVIEIKKE